MLINNFEALEYYINPKHENDFYVLHVIARKKDNPDLDRTERFLKDYYIRNKESYRIIQPEIAKICKTFGARAYLYCTARNYDLLSLSLIERTIKSMKDGFMDCHNFCRSLSSGKHAIKSDAEKFWMIDVDDPVMLGHVREIADSCRSGHSFNVISVIPTLHGYHAITTPFDSKEYMDKFKKIPDIKEIPEIHKNSPVLAYYENTRE